MTEISLSSSSSLSSVLVITAHLITFHTSVAALAVDAELAVGARLVMHALVHVLKEKIHYKGLSQSQVSLSSHLRRSLKDFASY